jgi:RNA polymerase sigma-70 factor (ECF subfamily)
LDELMPRMRSFALRMLAHPEDAEDAVQDALVKAHAARDGFRGQSTVATWLFSILTRVCIDRLRARRRYLWNAQDITRTSDEVDHSLVGVELRREDARFEAREHIAFCFSCVGRTLPPEEAAAVMLKEVFGHSNRESADIAGVSESVHRHRLAAGRRAMTDVFDNLCGLVAKTGVCHQCKGLREHAPPDKRGRELPVLSSDADEAWSQRVEIARDADMRSGSSAGLHRVMFRAVQQVGEAPAKHH